MTAPVHDRVMSFTALGLQLWDPLTDKPVAGLTAVARRRTGGTTTEAFTTDSNVYAFRGLDGMALVERPDPAQPPDWSAPSVPTSEFVVAATDGQQRFLPMVVTVDVPHLGLVTTGDVVPTSVPNESPVYLFSSVARALPPGTAAVRARLAGAQGTPLAFAVVEVGRGPDRWIGVSDRDGQVVVPFPWPTFAGAIVGSPAAGTAGTPSADQSWQVTVTVRSDHGVLDLVDALPEPGAEWPTLASLFAQPARDVFRTEGQPAVPFITSSLHFGRDLVVATTNQDEALLLVDGVTP